MASFTCLYNTSNSFTIINDVREYFPQNIAVKVNCNGVWVYSIVDSSSYAYPSTTVTIKTTDLTDPCTEARVVLHPFGTPWHEHDSVHTGGPYVVGISPDHQWSETYLRVREPDGSWGTYVNLLGPSLNTTGDWVTSRSYSTLDVCTNGRSSYVCYVAHTSSGSNEPGTVGGESYWEILAEGIDAPGSDSQILYNNGGDIGGDQYLNWDDIYLRLGVGVQTPRSRVDIGQGGLTLESLSVEPSTPAVNTSVLFMISVGGLQYLKVKWDTGNSTIIATEE